MATEKKRSSYNRKSQFSFPEWTKDDKKFGYRWINAAKHNDRSDGFDHRGWVLAKIPEGQPKAGEYLRNKDCILAKMPIEEIEDIRARVAEETRMNTEAVAGAQKELSDQVAHEFKQAGGKLKLNVSID